MIPEKYEHGGNIEKIISEINASGGRNIESGDLIDFSANINPLGIPDKIRFFLNRNIDNLDRYPDPESKELRQTAGNYFNVNPENILPSNGASELFFLLVRILEHKKIFLLIPSYSDYERAGLVENREIVFFELSEEREFLPDLNLIEEKLEGGEIVILGRPNNPTGKNIPRDELLNLIKKHPETFFIIDEAFGDFINFEKNDGSIAPYILPNLVTIISLTKMYAIPGLRAGLAVGPGNIIEKAEKYQSSWPLNFFAQKAAVLALNDKEHLEKTKDFIIKERTYIYNEISKIKSLKVYMSEVNFLLFKTVNNEDAESLYGFLLKNNVILRRCGNFKGLSNNYFRIAVLRTEDNKKLINLMRKFFNLEAEEKSSKTPAIMILGTGSNVGKSLLCTALCRIFLNEGYRVMPFKAQNMSLNSCVTWNGDEISRAQHLQALAAKAEPDVKMNPVLLKPVEKSLSQIILMGKSAGNLGYRDYRRNREKIWKAVCDSYDELSRNADLMIIEGAGSPVEMNLKEYDIVNMKMAEYADAKVILAGNIDYGGIFAAFAGTLMLLNNEERKRIIGLFVNQFRGDESLFTEGKNLLEEITGKKILGTIPYAEKHMLPDEDSLSFGNRSDNVKQNNSKSEELNIKIYVPKYPHMSNFTDFDPFYGESGIELKFLEVPEKEDPDIIILPGSKNVAADLEWLKEHGFWEYIFRLRESQKTEIVGVCGGFQMLGIEIKDPHGIENQNLQKTGLGLMGISTEMEIEKVLKKFQGLHKPSKIELTGYEIHHGRTQMYLKNDYEKLENIFENSPEAGLGNSDGMIWGTYIHGIFDNDDFRLWLINKARKRRALKPLNEIENYSIETAIENFSKMVREKIDLEFIKNAVGLK